jgi:hypothetical protein
MNEFDAIRIVAETLSERKRQAALSNYQVLTNNISYVNDIFQGSLTSLVAISNEIKTYLDDDSVASPEVKDNSRPLYYFRKILPRIISNGIQICEKFQQNTAADDRTNVNLENIHLMHRSFADYSDLVTATRQMVDSLVSDSYQMICLNPKSLNYHVLSSLSSFEKYATKSIWDSIANDELRKLLNEFNSLKFRERAHSPISQCSHNSFAKKLSYIFLQLRLHDDGLNNDLNNIFKFSSEFTHVGYVSTMFSGTYDFESIFGDDQGPYLPSTENFAELKYRMLETAISLYTRVYLPSIRHAVSKLLNDSLGRFSNRIDVLIDALEKGMRTRNNQYYFFIRAGIVGSDKDVDFFCKCGEKSVWRSPHDRGELFCKKCGSSFNLIEMEGDPGYVITSEGPVKVIGSNVPDLDDLPQEEFKKLWAKCKEIERRRS